MTATYAPILIEPRERQLAIEADGKTAAVEAAAARGIALGTTVRRVGTTRTRGYGTGVVTHLYSQCSHALRAHPSMRRSRCASKSRTYVTVRWNSGQRWNGETRETVTAMPLARVEAI